MKAFYNKEKAGIYYSLYGEGIEVRHKHSFFWGLISITTSKFYKNNTI